MNTPLTKAVLADCAASLLAANPDFHEADYKDNCFCKKNLEWVIRQINAEQHADERQAVAKHYAEIIARNNATTQGCERRHIWVLSATEAIQNGSE